jgi:hypothetical protein
MSQRPRIHEDQIALNALPSIDNVGTLFDRNWTDEDGFNGKETVRYVSTRL